MLTQLIWWGGMTLESLILVRSIQAKLALRYPTFFGYISFIFLQDVLSFVIYRWYPRVYPQFYWTTEFLGLVLGCAIVFEVYRKSLESYPGATRVARNVLALVFALAFGKVLADLASNPQLLPHAGLQLELVLKTIQALAIVALAALFLFYSIPFGRNLRGILLGYGLFVGMRVISLTFLSTGKYDFWYYSYSGCYFVALAIWCGHLWSYSASPQPKAVPQIEQDYQTIAAATHRRLQNARGYLAKAVRP
jgi:hypothetical protein